MPIPDRHCRERTVSLGPVQLGMRLDLTRWTVGVWADMEPASLGFDLGQLGLTISHDGWNGPLPAWFVITLARLVVGRLEMRLACDLNIWLLGYCMADARDHGIYCGPLNLQIEYDKCWWEGPPGSTPPPLEPARTVTFTMAETRLPLTVHALCGRWWQRPVVGVEAYPSLRTGVRNLALVSLDRPNRVRIGQLASHTSLIMTAAWITAHRDLLQAYWRGHLLAEALRTAVLARNGPMDVNPHVARAPVPDSEDETLKFRVPHPEFMRILRWIMRGDVHLDWQANAECWTCHDVDVTLFGRPRVLDVFLVAFPDLHYRDHFDTLAARWDAEDDDDIGDDTGDEAPDPPSPDA